MSDWRCFRSHAPELSCRSRLVGSGCGGISCDRLAASQASVSHGGGQDRSRRAQCAPRISSGPLIDRRRRDPSARATSRSLRGQHVNIVDHEQMVERPLTPFGSHLLLRSNTELARLVRRQLSGGNLLVRGPIDTLRLDEGKKLHIVASGTGLAPALQLVGLRQVETFYIARSGRDDVLEALERASVDTAGIARLDTLRVPSPAPESILIISGSPPFVQRVITTASERGWSRSQLRLLDDRPARDGNGLRCM